MKSWWLDNQQRVYVDHHRNVHFQHYYNKLSIALTWRQFLNLNDIIMDLETFQNMKYYPLGKNLWLQCDRYCIQLYHCKRHRYFSFHDRSWSKYIKETHRSILSFLRHEALHRGEHAASDAYRFQSKSRDTSSLDIQQQTLSRTTSHARGKNEQWKKCADLSEWNNSNPGRSFSVGSSVDAMRTTTDIVSDLEEEEVIQLDCTQSGDF